MLQTQPRKFTFKDYLAYEDDTDNRYELIDGELVPLAPESGLNDFIASFLSSVLVDRGLTSLKLSKVGRCEIQVPVLQRGDAANRFPDLVVLREEHWQLTKRRLTVTLEMPPPRLVAEVVSPYKSRRDENYRRDYHAKRFQYAATGIPEYWIIDPTERQILVLQLEAGEYVETIFCGESPIVSRTFPELELSAQQVFEAAE